MNLKMMGNITVVQHGKRGMKAQSFVWQEVTHTPYEMFSLFSLYHIMNEGCTLHGDTNALVFRRGNNEVNFNIKITNTKGALYCVHFKRTIDAAIIQAITNTETSYNKKMSIKLADDILGHTDNNKP